MDWHLLLRTMVPAWPLPRPILEKARGLTDPFVMESEEQPDLQVFEGAGPDDAGNKLVALKPRYDEVVEGTHKSRNPSPNEPVRERNEKEMFRVAEKSAPSWLEANTKQESCSTKGGWPGLEAFDKATNVALDCLDIRELLLLVLKNCLSKEDTRDDHQSCCLTACQKCGLQRGGGVESMFTACRSLHHHIWACVGNTEPVPFLWGDVAGGDRGDSLDVLADVLKSQLKGLAN
ncbi:hypothetical protein OF83DRAFT_1185913 [Amylostereum chailletii]|nr:hypothetical protein OF83DRAFT_1185913 [Amylostereum chailletii]